ncbi:hypothetical protein L211DRAFT_854392 [Terfezia boudieri ATCC MYA-4762]|uniref:Uncharacterized protein n=1 Tax=Terfezia boudieri ATCC MYA-4762 TaxID=1051890 RepID=A0A3N4L5H6_9PEZI|nr:hypothetical protein L211DRAFT_854392 [Terfezia boudieri ATCC MYA-4762]
MVVQPMSESFYTSPTGEIQRMTACAAGEAEEALARAEAEEALARARTVIPDSTESTRESSLEPIPFPFRQTPTISTPIGGATSDNNRVEPTSRISVEPGRDSYMEGNTPICNLGTSGKPLEVEPGAPPPAPRREPADAQMANNAQGCQPGLDVSIHASSALEEEAVESGIPSPVPTQKETEVEIRRYKAETEEMIWKVDSDLLTERGVIARVVEAAKKKPSVLLSRKIQWNIQRAPAFVGGFDGKFQEASRYKTPEEEGTHINAFLE